MDEFGMGSHNQHSFFGPALNPIDIERVTGGSSGGSAAAVANGSCTFAIGSDTGGSVRLPAAFCNLFGLKPSYGMISRYGLIAYANSLDTVGIMAKDVKTLINAFTVLAEDHDPKDPANLHTNRRNQIQTLRNEWYGKVAGNPQQSPLKSIRIGIPQEYFPEELFHSGGGEDVFKAVETIGDCLSELGAELVPVSLPWTRYALPAYYIISSAEASSNLSRYDGLRFGYSHSSNEQEADGDSIVDTRHEAFGREVQRRILTGTFVLSHDSYNEYFIQAQRIRQHIKMDFDKCFRPKHILNDSNSVNATTAVDAILVPTSTQKASLIKDCSGADRNPVDEYLNDVFTIPASLAGLPALTVPHQMCGVQLISQYGHDYIPLFIADALQQNVQKSVL